MIDLFERRYRREDSALRFIQQRDLPWANILPRIAVVLSHVEHFLDVGSGSGAVACFVAAQGIRVTALDRAPSAVALGEDNARTLGVRNIDFKVWDLDSPRPLPLEEPVDLVFASEVFEHLRDDQGALCRIRAGMLPHGLLLATSPSSTAPIHRLRTWLRGGDALDAIRGHERRYSPDAFRSLARNAGFATVTVTPIAGLIRDVLYGSMFGLKLTRLVRRPLTSPIQWLDALTISFASSQLLLEATAPSNPPAPADGARP